MNWKKKIVQTLWLLVGLGTIVLFGGAMQQKNKKVCADVKVDISGVEEHLFIDENDVKEIIHSDGRIKNMPMDKVDLHTIETALETTPWVKNAELFFDNKQVLQIKIIERQPVARVFTVQGSSFYLDSAGLRLPLSDKLSARVPMFTNFPNDKGVMAKPDSLLLQSVVSIGKYIIADSFWMAQTAQIAITPLATFEIVPTIGDQVIVLGTADNLDNKFARLYTFYKKAWLQNGMNTYEKLDVQYVNQVVAVKKGTAKMMIDSAKVTQLLGLSQSNNITALTDTLNKVKTSISAARPLMKNDSVKLIKPMNKLAQKKKLVDNKLKNNKKAIIPLSILNNGKLVKSKAIMHNDNR